MYLIGRIKTPFISFMRSRRTILSHCWLTWTFWNPFSHSSIFSKRQSFICFYLIILLIDYRLLHICLTVIHCNKKSTDILLVLFSVVLWSEFLRSFKLIVVLMCVKSRIKGPLFWQSRAGSNLKTENCLKACIWEKRVLTMLGGLYGFIVE